MKILFVPSKEMDGLEDIIYHGLIKILGRKNVVDFPPKPSYHADKETAKSKPLYFYDKKGFEYYKDLNEPRIDEFDTIIFGSLREDVLDIVAKFLRIAKRREIFTVFLDGEDDMFIRNIYNYVNLYFKRECLLKPSNVLFSFQRFERFSKHLIKIPLSPLIIPFVKKSSKIRKMNIPRNKIALPIGISSSYLNRVIPLPFGIVDIGFKPKKRKTNRCFIYR